MFFQMQTRQALPGKQIKVLLARQRFTDLKPNRSGLFDGEFGAAKKTVKKAAVKKPATKKKAVKFVKVQASTGLKAVKASAAASGSAGMSYGQTRRVEITGNADFNTGIWRTESGAESELKQDFVNQGWEIHNLDLQPNGRFYGNMGINISADVSSDFSNQSHLDQAYRIFNAYTINVGLGAGQIFSNINLKISGDDRASVSGGTKTGSSISGTRTPEPTGSNGNSGGNDDDSNFLDKLGLGLGLSTPVVLAAALGIIIILKR